MPACLPVSGSAPASLTATAPADGLLRASRRGRTDLDSGPLDDERARSPIDRYGSITFVRRVRAGEAVTLKAESRDSPGNRR